MEFQLRGFRENANGKSMIALGGKQICGEWVYGSYHNHEAVTPAPIGGEPFERKSLIIRDGFSDWNMPKPIEAIPVVPETIGMKYDKCDKNGTPIYVGDVIALTTADGENITIECKFGTVQRQIYENLVEITGFYFERSNDGRKTFPIVNNYLGKHDTEIWEVIGTIFDVKEEAK